MLSPNEYKFGVKVNSIEMYLYENLWNSGIVYPFHWISIDSFNYIGIFIFKLVHF